MNHRELDSSFSHLSLGRWYLEYAKYGEAVDEFEKAVQEAPADPSVLAGYGLALFHLGRRDEVAELHEKAKAIDSAHPDVLALDAIIRSDLGDSMIASDYASAAFRGMPHSSYVMRVFHGLHPSATAVPLYMLGFITGIIGMLLLFVLTNFVFKSYGWYPRPAVYFLVLAFSLGLFRMLPYLKKDFLLIGSLIFFAVLPFFIVTACEDHYVLPKYTLMVLAALFIAKAVIDRRVNKKIERFDFSRLWLPGLLYLAAQIISLINADSLYLSVQEIVKISAVMLIFLYFLNLLKDRSQLEAVLELLALGAFITSIFVLLIDFGLLNFGIANRLGDWRGVLGAGFGNSGYVAEYLAMTFPVSVYLFYRCVSRKTVLFLGLFIGLTIAALIVLFSVSANGAMIIAAILWLVLVLIFIPRDFWRRRLKRTAVLIGIMLLVILFYSTPNPLNGRQGSIFTQAFGSKRLSFGGPSRVLILIPAWNMAKGHPFIGVGANNFTMRYLDFQDIDKLKEMGMERYAGSVSNEVHNEYLRMWAETGLLGLLSFLAILIVYLMYLFKTLRGSKDSADRFILISTFTGLVIILLDSCMWYPLKLPVSSIIFVFFLAVPFILGRVKSSRAVESVNLSLWQKRVVAAEKNRTVKKGLAVRIYQIISLLLLIAFSMIVLSHFSSWIYLRQARAVRDRVPRIYHYPDVAAQSEGLFLISLKLDPWNPHPARDLGGMLAMIDRNEDAVTYLEMARKNSRDFWNNYWLGWALYKTNRPDEARAVWDEAKRWRPQPLMHPYLPDIPK